MISLEDCIALCGLSRDEIDAIAEHQHVPEICAAALAQYLMHKKKGPEFIRDMIVGDVRAAQARGDRAHTQELLHVLHHFMRDHPEARKTS